MEIDLNADLGEGAGHDAELMPLITSANVCCGLHAGGPGEIAATLVLAKRYNVTVGAHPGYPDREYFGRREFDLSMSDVFDLCEPQVRAFGEACLACGLPLRYLKPHGAMYNQAGRNVLVAEALLRVCEAHRLTLVGLPGSLIHNRVRGRVPFASEGFADRRYKPDGSLVPRSEPDAFVHDPDEAVRQVEWLVQEKGVRTVCVHGDNPEAVAFTTAVRERLLARGFTLKPFA